MGNIKNTKLFHKLTRVWGSTNSVRTADSYAEYLAAAEARGDGRSPVPIANLVTLSVGGWGSVPPHPPPHKHKHPIPHQGAPTRVLFPRKSKPRTSMKDRNQLLCLLQWPFVVWCELRKVSVSDRKCPSSGSQAFLSMTVLLCPSVFHFGPL